MAESTPDSPLPLSDTRQKPPNILRKAKEEMKAVLHGAKVHTDEMINNLDESTGGITTSNMFKAAKKEMKAAMHTGRKHLLHKLAHGKANNGGGIDDEGSSPDSVEETESSEGEKEVHETMPLDLQAVAETVYSKHESQTYDDKRDQSNNAELKNGESENGDKKHHLIESAKEETKAILHQEKSPFQHYQTGTHAEAVESSKEEIDAAAHHEESENHHLEQANEEIEAGAEKVPDEEKPIQSSERKWGFMHCVAELLEKVCSPK